MTSDGKIEKSVHQSINLIEEKMFLKKKCLERVSNVSYGSVENGAKKKDDTLFHFFFSHLIFKQIFWSLFLLLNSTIITFTEHFSKLWELWWKYYILHLKLQSYLATRWKQTRHDLPFNTHLCAVCLWALKISHCLVKKCILLFSFLLSTHTSTIL